MREDMDRVIITHPRHGDKQSKGRRSLRKRQDLEEAPKRERMRPTSNEVGGWDGAKYNNLGEYLTPLKRYIESQVGRHWDKVYSEIRQRIDPGNAVQAHILQHLFGYIEAKCYMRDGEVWSHNYYGPDSGCYSPNRVGPGTLYVCPKSGIIRRMKGQKRGRRYRYGGRRDLNKREESGKKYEKIEGIWYEIKEVRRNPRNLRLVISKPYNKPDHPGYPVLRYEYYGSEKMVVTDKRQLNSKELRQLKVSNG